MNKKTLSTIGFAVIMLFSLGYGTTAQAFSMKLPEFMGGRESERKSEQEDRRGRGEDDRPGIRMMIGQGITGTVTAVSATSITVNGKHASTSGSFVVDVTASKFFKNSATTTLTSILVGDNVFVQGSVNGTSAIASAVYDGKLPAALQKVQIRKEEKKEDRQEKKEVRQEKREDRKADRMNGSAILGIVTNVNGNTILVDGKMGTSTATTTYTVDATSAKIFKDKATTTVSAILVGDKVLVEGTVSGTTVTARFIFDGKLPLNGKALGAFAEEPVKGKFIEKINHFFKKFFKRD